MKIEAVVQEEKEEEKRVAADAHRESCAPCRRAEIGAIPLQGPNPCCAVEESLR